MVRREEAVPVGLGGCGEGGRAGRRCVPGCREQRDGDGARGRSALLTAGGVWLPGPREGEQRSAGGARCPSGALRAGAATRGCGDRARAEPRVVGVVPSSLRPAGAARAFTRKASLAASAGRGKSVLPGLPGRSGCSEGGKGEKGSAGPALLCLSGS